MDPEKAMWVGTGIPPRLRGISFDDIERLGGQPQALKKARLYVDGFRAQQSRTWRGAPANPHVYGLGLLFAGPPSTGKTTLAAAVLCELRRRWGVSIYCTRYSDHIERERSLMRADGQTDAEQLSRWTYASERASHAQVLLLDAVGLERSTETRFAEETLERLVRARFDDGRPTLITTSLSGDDWARRYSKSLRAFMDQCTRREIFVNDPAHRATA